MVKISRATDHQKGKFPMANNTTTTTDQTNSRTRGLHKGTDNHKIDCPCLVCKGKRYDSLQLVNRTLVADVTRLQVSNDHNAAEAVRLAEALRLAEQGRDEAIRGRSAGLEQIKKLQEQLTVADRTANGYQANLETAKQRVTVLEGRIELQGKDGLDLAHRLASMTQERDLLRSDKDNLLKQLGLADQEVMGQRLQVHAVRSGGMTATVAISFLCALISFLVGRLAR